MRFLRSIYVTNRLFLAIGLIAVIFAFSFALSVLFPVAQLMLLGLILICIVDLILLYHPSNRIAVERTYSNVLSLSDDNRIRLHITSETRIPLKIFLIDELPFQLQDRKFSLDFILPAHANIGLDYTVRPVVRGSYTFGNVLLYASSAIGLMRRRHTCAQPSAVPVYPSIIQMRAYELKTLNRISFFEGVKKMRRIGHSYEFDQIKQYVLGDDIRHINWKATGRLGHLMVNHYEEEKSQQVICIIDKSRNMKMPFNGLSLLDYAVNSTLTISNIALRKEDRVGLVTFSDTIGTKLSPDKHATQLRKILEALYSEKERFTESNYALMYQFIRNFARVRSLIFLYTNFESLHAIERVAGILRKLNKLHLLVVIFFENEGIGTYARSETNHLEDVYLTTIAEKFVVEKQQILLELTRYGIQTIISRPEDLSINTINKYLELKSRGLI